MEETVLRYHRDVRGRKTNVSLYAGMLEDETNLSLCVGMKGDGRNVSLCTDM